MSDLAAYFVFRPAGVEDERSTAKSYPRFRRALTRLRSGAFKHRSISRAMTLRTSALRPGG
jgi:hypothetical protein